MQRQPLGPSASWYPLRFCPQPLLEPKLHFIRDPGLSVVKHGPSRT